MRRVHHLLFVLAACGGGSHSENVAIRQLAFHQDGSVEDLGTLDFGDGLSAINGVIGVTP